MEIISNPYIVQPTPIPSHGGELKNYNRDRVPFLGLNKYDTICIHFNHSETFPSWEGIMGWVL